MLDMLKQAGTSLSRLPQATQENVSKLLSRNKILSKEEIQKFSGNGGSFFLSSVTKSSEKIAVCIAVP